MGTPPENILISDIYMRAKELHVAAEVPRAVFVIRPLDDRDESVPLDVVQSMFPDRQVDFVLSKFTPEEAKIVDERALVACDAIKAFALSGMQFAMCNYNNK